MYKLLAVTALVAAVAAHDLTVGQSPGGKQIYHENITASPAIWRQTQTVKINVTEGEVISCIVVKDNRPDKNGEVKITEGGEGKENVTIELKSPTIFRGLNFSVDVYSVPQNEYVGNDTQSPIVPLGDDTPSKVPGPQENQAVNIPPAVSEEFNDTVNLSQVHGHQENQKVNIPESTTTKVFDTKGQKDSELNTVTTSVFPSSTEKVSLDQTPLIPSVVGQEEVKGELFPSSTEKASLGQTPLIPSVVGHEEVQGQHNSKNIPLPVTPKDELQQETNTNSVPTLPVTSTEQKETKNNVPFLTVTPNEDELKHQTTVSDVYTTAKTIVDHQQITTETTEVKGHSGIKTGNHNTPLRHAAPIPYSHHGID